MGKLFPIIFMLLFHSACIAQTGMNKDSLLKLLSAAKEDTAKVNLYVNLADEYVKDNLPESEKYILLAEALGRKLHYNKGVLKYYSTYSDILMRKGKLDSAVLLNLDAISFAEKIGDSVETGRTMLNAGMAYKQLQDFENAVSYVERGRDLLIRNGEHKYDGKTYDFLQFLYYSMHQYRRGVDNGLKAVAFFEKTGDKDGLQYSCNNLGLNYVMLKEYDSAKYFLNKANTLADETGELIIPISVNLNFALIALKEQQLDSLKFYANKALAIAQKFNAEEAKGLAQYGLAYYYLLKNDYKECGIYADSALHLAQRYSLRDLKQKIYPVLASLNFALKDGKQGYYYFSQYEALTDSILNESVARNTVQTEKRFQTERQQAQIRIQEAEIRQKTIFNYILIGGSALLLFIFFLIYRNYRSRQILQQVKIDELESEKKLTATEAVFKGEEQEQARLAKDLHDGLGGMLSGIKHSLYTIKGNMLMTPENVHTFERSIDMLDSSIKEMRRVAHNMMPEILIRYGLDAALKEFCREITQSGVMKTTYQSIDMDRIKPEQATAVTVYRIVQELVNNAIKHSGAENILVQAHASEQENILTLTVEDDGKGFDTAELKNADGMGWSNIQKRAEFLKGKIDIHSGKDKGTSVLVEIKL